MLKKIVIGAVVALVGFLAYVQTRPSTFRYERSGVIAASPEKIFPYISQLKLGSEWSPYEKKDLNMKKTLSGPAEGAGQVMDFYGNQEVGAGRLEVLKVVSNERVEIKLMMTEPVVAENLIEYTLTPEGDGTRFTWALSGDGGFLTQLISVFIDCEKMVAGDFEKGIASLKAVIEAK